MADDAWSGLNAGAITGAGFLTDQGSGGVRSGLESAVTTSGGSSSAPIWSPENPMFWVGGLLAATFGFIGFTSWVDVGPLKGKVKA